nr:hypothetical protein Iba_chr12cCG7800 [Ipomoea batatas]
MSALLPCTSVEEFASCFERATLKSKRIAPKITTLQILRHTENLRGCDLRVESPLAISTAQLTTSPSLLATGIPFTIDSIHFFQFCHRLSTLSTFAWGDNQRD